MSRTILAYLEGTPSDALMQFATCTDGMGVTWVFGVPPDMHDANNIWTTNIVQGTGRILIGNTWFFGEIERQPFDMIAQSTDEGTNWSGTVSEAQVPDDSNHFWEVMGGTRVDATRMFFAGYLYNGITTVETNLWKSEDGGDSFDIYEPATLAGTAGREFSSIATLDDDTTVILTDPDLFARKVWRSTDRGDTWASTTLAQVGAFNTVCQTVVPIGAGVVLVVGRYIDGGGNQKPTLWRSTDSGASWTPQADPFAGLSYPAFDGDPPGGHGGGPRQKPLWIGLGAGDGLTALVAMRGNTTYVDAFRWFRFTNDGGVTWQTCNYTSTPDQRDYGEPQQITRADDGSWLCIVTYNGRINDGSDVEARGEMWRGVPDGTTLNFTRVFDVTQFNSGTGVTCASGGVLTIEAATPPPPPPPPPPPTPMPAITQGAAGIFPTRIVAVYRP